MPHAGVLRGGTGGQGGCNHLDEGFWCKMAENDAVGFLAYRDRPMGQPAQEKDRRNDSVSGVSIGERIRGAEVTRA